MKKKLLITLLVITTIFCCVFSLSACDLFDSGNSNNSNNSSNSGNDQDDGHSNGDGNSEQGSGHKHLYKESIIDPLCWAQGYTLFSCKCGDSYMDNYTDLLGHDYKGGFCTRCGESVPTKGLMYQVYQIELSTNEPKYYTVSGRGNATEKDIIIPSVYNGKPVIQIDGKVFKNCDDITSVTIPKSILTIGSSAFEGCSSLTSIIIPDNVITINNRAFFNTAYYNDENNWENGVIYIGNHLIKAQTSISGSYEIKQGTLTIAEQAFYKCSSLSSITIPESVANIGASVFDSCSSLETVYFNATACIKAGYSMYPIFEDCINLTTVVLGDNVSNIPSPIFYGCSSLTNITIPDSVTSIGTSAFYGCGGLTSVTLGKGATSIGNSAFAYCSSLSNITIPDSVTSIGSSAFSNTAYYNNENNWENGVLYIGNHLIETQNELSNNYEIKSGTLTIADNAFKNCSGLAGITIPASVTSIGEYAFDYCRGLTSIIIPASVKSIGERAFGGCSGLTSIIIPASVTNINDYAFIGCSSLTSVTISDGVTSIGYSAFGGCNNLTSITFKGTKEQWASIEKGDDWDEGTGDYTVHCTNGDIIKQQ